MINILHSGLDIGLGVLLLLFLIRGLLRGLLNEVAGLIGIFLGLVLAGRFYQRFESYFTGFVTDPELISGLAYGAIFIVTLVMVGLLAAVLRRFISVAVSIIWLDSLLGAAVGVLKGVFVCGIILALMQRFVSDSPFLKNSLLAGYLDGVAIFARSLLPAFIDTVTII